jgi:hypothetical protein
MTVGCTISFSMVGDIALLSFIVEHGSVLICMLLISAVWSRKVVHFLTALSELCNDAEFWKVTISRLESRSYQITECGYDVGVAYMLWKHPSDSSCLP